MGGVMSKFDAFIKDKPECFGYRRDLVSVDVPCTRCKHLKACLSSVWAVFDAVRSEKLPANDYSPIELREFRRRHRNVCDYYCRDADQKFPFEFVEHLHDRVLPRRSHSRSEVAHGLEDSLSDDDTIESDSSDKDVDRQPVATEIVIASHMTASPTALAAPTIIVAPKAVSAFTGTYHFPMPTGRPFNGHTNDDLTKNLARLVMAFQVTPAFGYGSVRDELCAIHIEMNFRQQQAPRFRPTNRLRKKLHTAEEIAESLDRQVIDLHWLAHSANKPAAPANHYPTIFNNDPFDLGAAERFAQENWSPAVKAVHLHLTEEMEWANAIIQGQDTRKAWLLISSGDVRGDDVKQEGAPHIEKRLREAVHRENRSQVTRSIPGMVDAWKARKIVGDSPVKIAAVVALMTGEKPRDPRAMKRTLKSLDAYLVKALRAKK
jgi:hypothetical protein